MLYIPNVLVQQNPARSDCYEAALSMLSGLEASRRISEETALFVLLMVRRQSLASLLGSSRPRMPLERITEVALSS